MCKGVLCRWCINPALAPQAWVQHLGLALAWLTQHVFHSLTPLAGKRELGVCYLLPGKALNAAVNAVKN